MKQKNIIVKQGKQPKNYKGLKYTTTRISNVTIFQAYDRGLLVVYAMSRPEFIEKANIYVDRGDSLFIRKTRSKK